jgi:hypothetical protein
MSISKANRPAHNYARHVEKQPTMRKEVLDTLSNDCSSPLNADHRSSLYHSGKENPEQVYLIAHNKAYYCGGWEGGFPEGNGYCIFADGSYYEGNFNHGDAEDKEAYLILPNGASYRGEVKNSVIEGEGELRHNIGN